MPTLLVLTVALTQAGGDLRVVAARPPLPATGQVPVYEWLVEWALRDDTKPSLGMATYKTFAAARAAADRRLADRGEPGTFWYVKSVHIVGKAVLADPDQLDRKPARVWKAVQAGVDKGAVNCNELVRDIAAAAGVPGLTGKTADQMWGYFATAAAKDGWVKFAATKSESAIEAANRLAADGQLVVGVISAERLNAAYPDRPKPYTNGHVFAVAPTGGANWASTLLANAILGGPPAGFVPATKTVDPHHFDAYEFYAIPLADK